MHNNRLYNLLQSLTPQEFRELGRFLKSPIHNSNKKIIQLYGLIKKSYPDLHLIDKSVREKLYTRIYPGKKYQQAVVRNLLYEFTDCIEDYLSFIDYRNNKFDYKKHLVEQLDKRDLTHLFEKNITEAMEILDSSPVRDENYYYSKYELESLFRKHEEVKTPLAKSQPLYTNVASEIDNLTYFFFIVMLKEYFKTLNREKHLKFEMHFKFIEDILTHLANESDTYKDIPLIKILNYFLSLYKDETDKNIFQHLKEVLEENINTLNTDDYKYFYIELYNYCKSRQSKGDRIYGKLSFEMIKYMLKNNILLQSNGTMTDHTYINIAASAMRVRALEWSEDFINSYKNKVPFEHRENAYYYNQAILNYIKGSTKRGQAKMELYGRSLDYLAKVKSEDFYYMTRIKNHALKIHYEMGEFDLAYSLIYSYRQYLTRNNLIPAILKERYLNYLNFLNELIKVNRGTEKTDLSEFIEKVKKTKNTEYRIWIMREIAKLQGRKV